MIRVWVFLVALVVRSSAYAQTPMPTPAPIDESADSVPAQTPEDEDREPRRWETPVRPVRRNAVLLYPIALIGRGLVVAYERALPDTRFTLLGRLSFASPAGGDLRSVEFGGSVAARYYFLTKGPFTRWEGRAPVGLYASLRLGLLRTWVADRRNGRSLGHADRLIVEPSIGYRFTIASRVELSPYVGAMFYSDLEGATPISARITAVFGLTVGGLF